MFIGSDQHFLIEKSIMLVLRIPWTEKPGRLQSMGSQRVGHYWATFTFIPDCEEYTYMGKTSLFLLKAY